MLKSVNKRASDILKQLKTPNNDLIPQIVYIGKNSANQWWIYETYFKEGIPSDSKTYYIDDAKEYQDYLDKLEQMQKQNTSILIKIADTIDEFKEWLSDY